MEWLTWGTVFWGFILYCVFKAVLDRISNNSRVSKMQKKVDALEVLTTTQTKSLKTVNDNQMILQRQNERLQEQCNSHREQINALIQALNDIVAASRTNERNTLPRHTNARSSLQPTPEPEEPTRPAPMGDGRRIINLDDD